MIRSILKRKSMVAVTAFAFVLCGGLVSAQDISISDEDALLERFVPELKDSSSQTQFTTASATAMSCLVDTPSFDQWGSPQCFSIGSATFATAFFRIDNPPSNFTILWSDSRCDSSKTMCSVPIRMFHPITMDATVLNNSNNTFVQVSATAWYEGLF
ncbi:MAG: hypothetical protein WD397_12245 [Wenzhouxiangellaceae bacterium]